MLAVFLQCSSGEVVFVPGYLPWCCASGVLNGLQVLRCRLLHSATHWLLSTTALPVGLCPVRLWAMHALPDCRLLHSVHRHMSCSWGGSQGCCVQLQHHTHTTPSGWLDVQEVVSGLTSVPTGGNRVQLCPRQPFWGSLWQWWLMRMQCAQSAPGLGLGSGFDIRCITGSTAVLHTSTQASHAGGGW